jgi:hypothetical protein
LTEMSAPEVPRFLPEKTGCLRSKVSCFCEQYSSF